MGARDDGAGAAGRLTLQKRRGQRGRFRRGVRHEFERPTDLSAVAGTAETDPCGFRRGATGGERIAGDDADAGARKYATSRLAPGLRKRTGRSAPATRADRPRRSARGTAARSRQSPRGAVWGRRGSSGLARSRSDTATVARAAGTPRRARRRRYRRRPSECRPVSARVARRSGAQSVMAALTLENRECMEIGCTAPDCPKILMLGRRCTATANRR